MVTPAEPLAAVVARLLGSIVVGCGLVTLGAKAGQHASKSSDSGPSLEAATAERKGGTRNVGIAAEGTSAEGLSSITRRVPAVRSGTAGCALSHYRAWTNALSRGVTYELARPRSLTRPPHIHVPCTLCTLHMAVRLLPATSRPRHAHRPRL